MRRLFYSTFIIITFAVAVLAQSTTSTSAINLKTQIKGLLSSSNGGTNLDSSTSSGCVMISAGVWIINQNFCADNSSDFAGTIVLPQGSTSSNIHTFVGTYNTKLVCVINPVNVDPSVTAALNVYVPQVSLTQLYIKTGASTTVDVFFNYVCKQNRS